MLGDFAHRRLPHGVTNTCDAWLMQCMQASREQLAEQWPQAYLAAPIWRFEWECGVVNGDHWFGVLMPSVDRVGRYFPLVITQAFEEPPTTESLDAWFEHLSHAAADTLQGDANLDDFEAALARAPAIASAKDADPAAQGSTRWWIDGRSAREPPRFAVPGLPAPGRFVAFLER